MNNKEKPNFYQKHKKVIVFTVIAAGVVAGVVLSKYVINNKKEDTESEDSEFRPIVESIMSATAAIIQNVPESTHIQESNEDFESEQENDQDLEETPEERSDSEEKITSVKAHNRKLPDGQNASPQKTAEAKEHGVVLAIGTTYVIEHERRIA